jgi:hypothetical protein
VFDEKDGVRLMFRGDAMDISTVAHDMWIALLLSH